MRWTYPARYVQRSSETQYASSRKTQPAGRESRLDKYTPVRPATSHLSYITVCTQYHCDSTPIRAQWSPSCEPGTCHQETEGRRQDI